ncbi:hypothetical protein KY362_01740 [Candidatus Woesearchaeota archaeon]|nr:hypothetical protein [Candidatus Woesearchaeota archaeon]
MARKNLKARNNLKRIKIKTRSRRSLISRRRSSFSGFDSVLDSHISVRNLLKYASIVLAFVIILGGVFLLGRVSASSETGPDADDERSSTLSGQTKQVVKENPAPEDAAKERSAAKEEIAEDDDPEVSGSGSADEEESIEYVYSPADYDFLPYEPEEDSDADDESDKEEEETCTPKVAEFDHNYTKVEIDVSNYQRTMKGDNWATLDSLKLTITNNEPCTIINPTQLKIKMNNKGKGSVWWDDEVHLPDSFKRMKPGTTVSEMVTVHVSYADVHQEKDFRAYVFDDYDIQMGVFKDYIFLP